MPLFTGARADASRSVVTIQKVVGVTLSSWLSNPPYDPPGNGASIYWAWTGAVTQAGVTVTHKLTAGAASARLVVSRNPDLSAPIYSVGTPSTSVSSVNGAVSNVVKQTATGLAPATTYYYGLMIDGVLDASKIGRFTTLSASQGSFTFALGGCCRCTVSSAVFSSILSKNPLFMFTLGDTPYGDTISPYTIDSAFDALLTSSTAAGAYRQIPTINMWSDHDFPTGPTSAGGANNLDGYSVGASGTAASLAFARAYWPNPPTYSSTATDAVGFSYAVGRILFVVPDCRSFMSNETDADGSTHTKWGSAQKAWVKAQFTAAKVAGQVVCLFTETPWIQDAPNDGDGWGNFALERREVMDFIQSVGIGGQTFIVASDMHALAIDDGTHTAGYVTSGSLKIPVFQVGALDQVNNANVGTYTSGIVQGVNQFGTVAVTDTGGDVGIAFQGYDVNGNAVAGMAYSFTVPAATLAAVTPGSTVPVNAAAPTISGTATVGQALTATTGTWSNAPQSYAYQWKRGGSTIAGATSSTYTLVAADQGAAISVAVTATNPSGNSAAATSAATAAVAAAAATLGALTLSPTSATAGTAYSGTISGQTSGSTIAASSSDGTSLTVSGSTVSGTFSAAGSPTVTLTETLSNATNSPKSSTFTVTVAAASAGTLNGYSYTNPEALAYAKRWTASPTATQGQLIDGLFTTLKGDGTYGLIDWLHLVASPASQSAVLDIKGHYDGTVSGSPVFTANAGYSGNGSTSNYIGTSYERNQATSSTKGASVNNESMFIWTLDTNAVSGAEYMIGSSLENAYLERTAATTIHTRPFSSTSTNCTTAGNNSGLIALSRTSSSAVSFYHNNVSGDTIAISGAAATSTAPSTATNITYCGDPGDSKSSTTQIAVAGMGQALSASNIATLYSALNTYLKGVGVTVGTS